MAAPCGVPLGLCAFRLTRLDETGCVDGSTDNSFVSTELISVQLTPVVEAGADTTLTGGCDCTIASYRGTDKLKRFEFELSFPKFAPAAYEMLLGSSLISDGSLPVGVIYPTELACGEAQAAVSLEFWVKNWNGDAQDVTYPWIHGVFPQTYWQVGQQQYQNDFAQPTFAGFSRKNDCWGNGPYSDGPSDEGYGNPDISTGAMFYATIEPPTDTACDYGDISPTS